VLQAFIDVVSKLVEVFAVALDEASLQLVLIKQTQAGNYHIRVTERVLHVLFASVLLPAERVKFIQNVLDHDFGADHFLMREVQAEVHACLAHFLLQIRHFLNHVLDERCKLNFNLLSTQISKVHWQCSLDQG